MRLLATSATIAVSGTALAGCGGIPTGGAVGYHEFTRAQAGEMAALCEGYFGTTEDISKRMGFEPTAVTYAQEPRAGACEYVASAPLVLSIGIEQDRDAILSVKGEKYFASLAFGTGQGVLLPDKVESLTDWLKGRANAVEDDYEDWLAALPTVGDKFVAATGFALDDDAPEATPIGTALVSPFAEVELADVVTPDYVLLDGVATSAGPDKMFVVASVTMLQGDELDIVPVYSLAVDGEDYDAKAAFTDITNTLQGNLLVAVPVGAKDVTLTVTTAELEQSMSILTGDVLDGGVSERLASGVKWGTSTYGNWERGRVHNTEGEQIGDGRTHPNHGTTLEWALRPWSSERGMAPEGQTHLFLWLDPDAPAGSMPLTPADMTITVNGNPFTPDEYDATTYRFHALVPEGVTQMNAELRAERNTAVMPTSTIFGPTWGPGYTLTGPDVVTWTIVTNS